MCRDSLPFGRVDLIPSTALCSFCSSRLRLQGPQLEAGRPRPVNNPSWLELFIKIVDLYDVKPQELKRRQSLPFGEAELSPWTVL